MGRLLRPVALAAPLILVAASLLTYMSTVAGFPDRPWSGFASDREVVRIGAKNFTEQLILGELMAQLVEEYTDLGVERRFNLGGTVICHAALESGQIDLYAEYTGTALTAILKVPVIADPDRAYEEVAKAYRERFAAEWLSPLGFDNTYAITVRREDAISRHLQSISDLARVSRTLRAGFTAEFSERPDGYPGLRNVYNLRFREVRDFDPALMYQAIAHGEVDAICAFATDGRMKVFDLQPLVDDRGFFPPYEASPVVLLHTLKKHPELREVLNLLAGRLDNATMQRLNFEVDQNRRRPRAVARKFLGQQGLLQEEE